MCRECSERYRGLMYNRLHGRNTIQVEKELLSKHDHMLVEKDCDVVVFTLGYIHCMSRVYYAGTATMKLSPNSSS